MREIIIRPNDADQRLDKFLSKSLNSLPPSLMHKFIRTKKIKVNRARTTNDYILEVGDVILLFIAEEFFQSEKEKDGNALSRITPKLNIIYEDKNIMLLNKRPGVLVHEDTEGNDTTLITHIKAYLHQKGEYDPASEQSFTPALCNRIDRNTGGIVIAAKNAAALRELNERIKNNEVDKFYLCAVNGIPFPKSATLTGYLTKDDRTNMVKVYDERTGERIRNAKKIITKYRTVSTTKEDALLEVELITGRTHQIRAHMAFIGHPLLGDGKYGVNKDERKKGYKYQALYAFRIRFAFSKDENPDNEVNVLSYLRGRTFEIDRSDIWFLKDFK